MALFYKKKCTKFTRPSFIFIFLLLPILANLPISKGADVGNSTDYTLRLVHVLYRHGDRAPISFFKTDPYQNQVDKYWPEGIGQLTKKGKAMEYALGAWLRRRYKHFVSNKFNPDEINVFSTDIDRTLMSAQCVLASFFYPTIEARFDSNLSWMPTPIHTAPAGSDKLLNLDSACPRIAMEMTKMQALPNVKSYIQHHKELFNYLSDKSGETLDTVLSVDFLFDTLKIEKIYNLTLPHWANEKFDDMRKVSEFSFAMNTLTQELKRLRGGPLVSLMIDTMQTEISSLSSKRKIFMFSAHDTTVAILLDTLGVFNKIAPPYASTVLVELHEREGKHTVKVLYQNDSTMTSEPYILVIPGCSADCPLPLWIKLLSDVTPLDWNSECYRPDPVRDHKYIMALTGGAMVGVVLSFVAGFLVHKRFSFAFHRRSENDFPHHCDHYQPLVNNLEL